MTSTAMTMKRSLRLLFYNLICLTGQPWVEPGHDELSFSEVALP
jgi:hypothetical protein